MKYSPTQLVRARIAVVFVFFINGAIFANWAVRIPEVQLKLNLSDGVLGLVLMGTAVGVITAVTTAGYLTTKFSSRTMTLVNSIAMALLLTPLSLVNSPLILFVVLLIFGYAASLMDIAMNAQAIIIERELKRSIMSSFHASYSIGGFAGAAFGGFLISLDVGMFDHFVIVSTLLALLLASLFQFLLHDTDAENASDPGPVLQFPPRVLWIVGFIGLASSVGEGSMADWSAIFLSREIGTTTSIAALGYAVYSLAMTVGRLSGDYAINRYSKAQVIQFAGIVSSTGFLVVSLIASTASTFIGYVLIGIGLSVVIPLLFSHAGNMDHIPSGSGIAAVATIGYIGFLAGPPMIGFIAEYTSLRFSFFLIGLFLLLMIPSSRTLRAST